MEASRRGPEMGICSRRIPISGIQGNGQTLFSNWTGMKRKGLGLTSLPLGPLPPSVVAHEALYFG